MNLETAYTMVRIEEAAEELRSRTRARTSQTLTEGALEDDGRSWGVGDQKASPSSGEASLRGGAKVALVTGQYPHSRASEYTYARFENGEVMPFDGHRHGLRMEFEPYNYVKESGMSGNEVRKGGEARIYEGEDLL